MESTIPQKLEALEKLQEIDSTLDEIFKVRGALPDEVRDLEDEIAGYQTRIDKFNVDLEKLEVEISDKKTAIKDSESLIKKYNDQQSNVRNNREYDAITKETELQALEIQINEKRIKEAFIKIEAKKEEIAGTQLTLDERTKDLNSKKSELDVISAESEEEEKKDWKKLIRENIGSWQEAQKQCQSKHNSSLISLNSYEEYHLMIDLITSRDNAKHRQRPGPDDLIFIGKRRLNIFSYIN